MAWTLQNVPNSTPKHSHFPPANNPIVHPSSSSDPQIAHIMKELEELKASKEQVKGIRTNPHVLIPKLTFLYDLTEEKSSKCGLGHKC